MIIPWQLFYKWFLNFAYISSSYSFWKKIMTWLNESCNVYCFVFFWKNNVYWCNSICSFPPVHFPFIYFYRFVPANGLYTFIAISTWQLIKSARWFKILLYNIIVFVCEYDYVRSSLITHLEVPSTSRHGEFNYLIATYK